MSDKRFVLAGVMGWPVAHTRSPAIHNHWIAKHGLKGAYVQLPVQPENLEAAIRGLSALGFAGCNVTVPHKVNAMKLMDEADTRQRVTWLPSTPSWSRPDGQSAGREQRRRGLHPEPARCRTPRGAATRAPALGAWAPAARRGPLWWACWSEGVPEVRITNRTAGTRAGFGGGLWTPG
jgi:shikimate dehydrogenase